MIPYWLVYYEKRYKVQQVPNFSETTITSTNSLSSEEVEP